MAPASDVERVGERVEELLGEISARADPAVTAKVEDLVRALMDLYGAALARTMTLVDDPQTRAALTKDPLLSALLVLHDLHPDSVTDRIEKALEEIRPHLGAHAGGIELLGVDAGVVRLRLEGTCHGCASSVETVRGAVEQAVLGAAPEVVAVEVEGMAEPAPVGFVPLGSVGLRCPTSLRVEALP